jgi:uncharacterized alkaline shock family protein YloU
MRGHASISPDILASYAADAAREVSGVRSLVDGRLPSQRAVRVSEQDGRVTVELHVAVDWGASIPRIGREVQERVLTYLARMADVEPDAVHVVVDEVG